MTSQTPDWEILFTLEFSLGLIYTNYFSQLQFCYAVMYF